MDINSSSSLSSSSMSSELEMRLPSLTALEFESSYEMHKQKNYNCKFCESSALKQTSFVVCPNKLSNCKMSHSLQQQQQTNSKLAFTNANSFCYSASPLTHHSSTSTSDYRHPLLLSLCFLNSKNHFSLRRFCTFLFLCAFVSSASGCGPGRGIGAARRSRKLTPLVFKQHVPNMSEKTLGASGLSEGAIHRDSPKFKDLVPNYNKDIIFKDEEGTGADRLMTRRCKEKLNTLAVSVMNQWPGVRLRVTESWDEEYFHGDNSLHYEGRAVDITTSDRDRTKYGMLARLAVEAGFDWVYYESRAHIHCSVKSDASHIPHMNGCFTPDSTVLTASGERKKMQDIAIGDRVLSMTETGDAVYSEVILFMDRNLEQTQEFVQLKTESGKLLTVTPSHLIMRWNKVSGIADYLFADRIEEGDFLFVYDQSGHLRPDRVVELKAVLRTGVVAPLTMEGTIVVDAVAASCYAIVKSQSLAHWSLAPMRLMAVLKKWLPGGGGSCEASTTFTPLKENVNPKMLLQKQKSKTMTTTTITTSTAQQQNGVHWYTKALFELKDYVLPKDWRYQ